jgi:Arc/MetJ family transcription regulator
MRTNIDIDDELVAEAQQLSGESTKEATVETALRLLIELRRQEELRELRGTVEWSGDLDESRVGRGVG